MMIYDNFESNVDGHSARRIAVNASQQLQALSIHVRPGMRTEAGQKCKAMSKITCMVRIGCGCLVRSLPWQYYFIGVGRLVQPRLRRRGIKCESQQANSKHIPEPVVTIQHGSTPMMIFP